MNLNKEYSPEMLKHLHDVELMMLSDFTDFCEKHDIIYFMDGGSLLGCIRHEGFIPWDDDIDIIMFRDQYEKFLKHSNELTDKYEILNSDNYEDYCRFYSKISLKGTKVDGIYDNNTDFDFGINMDVFVFDNIPKQKFKRKIFRFQRNVFNKFLWMYEVTTCDLYVSRNKERFGHLIRALYRLFHIDNKKLKRWGNKLVAKSKNLDSNYVCNLATSYRLDKFDKGIFADTKKVKFENLTVNAPIGFDDYLRIIYGDYMQLPPKEKRVCHGFDYIDFGEY